MLTLERLFSLWLDSDPKLLLVLRCDHGDGPDLAGGGGLASPGRGPHVHNVIHIVNVGPQDGRTIKS